MAAGWAACFLGALRRAATTRKIRLTSITITAEFTLTHGDDGEFNLSAVLNPVLGGVDQATAEELAHAATGSARTPRPRATTSPSPSTPPPSDTHTHQTAGPVPLPPARDPPPASHPHRRPDSEGGT
ncbi:hypothetical protein [Streptomyces sp. NRRL WC-3725]|uniref:hypothetical protein n=1 Tax=Streptomyces sp. NRRL WC-3725 TaxID=1463933 RepID=UPI003B63C15D